MQIFLFYFCMIIITKWIDLKFESNLKVKLSIVHIQILFYYFQMFKF